MMVPKQLANTMELIFVRSMPTTGAVAVMVIGPPAAAQSPEAEKYGLNECKQHAGLTLLRLSRIRSHCVFCCFASVEKLCHANQARHAISDIRPKSHLDDGV